MFEDSIAVAIICGSAGLIIWYALRHAACAEKQEEETAAILWKEENERAQERARRARKAHPFRDFADVNRALVSLMYSLTDGSDDQKKALVRVLEKYVDFNTGKDITPQVLATALHEIEEKARYNRLQNLEKLTLDMQHCLLVQMAA